MGAVRATMAPRRKSIMDLNQRATPMLAEHPEWRRGELTVTTDPARLDLDAICAFLARSYWAPKRSRDVIVRSLLHSIGFGVFAGARPVGFARVISDRATYGYVADVFVEESQRGAGVGSFLMECIKAHPELQGLERWSLATRDAHALYRKFGFQELLHPERHMEIPRRP
jgi:GNAT superfamily N-acetyltransferase